MAKIGYAYVGELADFANCGIEDTPDGMRYCRPLLVRELQKKQHKVFSLQYCQEKKSFPNVDYQFSGSFFPNIDILFIEWRWKTYKGDTFDLRRQNDLLSYYHGKIPIVFFDAAYQITAEDEEKWPKAIIADPGVTPRRLTRKRERLMFWSDFKPIEEIIKYNSRVGHRVYGYVGNDYERRNSFLKYYVDSSSKLRSQAGVQTAVYGNWLKESVERDPMQFLQFSEYSNIHFGGRWSFKDSMKIQSKFIATTHIAKKLYYEQGNITVRFFDALATGVPGLVPVEYGLNAGCLGNMWIVRGKDDVFDKVSFLINTSSESRSEIVETQKNTLLRLFPDSHVKSTVEFIESKI